MTRRDVLCAGGGLAVSAAAWPAVSLSASTGLQHSGSAKSCILIYLLGGPPHQDLFDLKPEAPTEVRGPFQPIATSVPGVPICEHLPRLGWVALVAPEIRLLL